MQNINLISTRIDANIFIEAHDKPLNFSKPLLKISNDSEIDGFVYVNGNVEHYGLIRGALWANNFIFQYGLTIYLGHLLDGKIIPSNTPLKLPLMFNQLNEFVEMETDEDSFKKRL